MPAGRPRSTAGRRPGLHPAPPVPASPCAWILSGSASGPAVLRYRKCRPEWRPPLRRHPHFLPTTAASAAYSAIVTFELTGPRSPGCTRRSTCDSRSPPRPAGSARRSGRPGPAGSGRPSTDRCRTSCARRRGSSRQPGRDLRRLELLAHVSRPRTAARTSVVTRSSSCLAVSRLASRARSAMSLRALAERFWIGMPSSRPTDQPGEVEAGDLLEGVAPAAGNRRGDRAVGVANDHVAAQAGQTVGRLEVEAGASHPAPGRPGRGSPTGCGAAADELRPRRERPADRLVEVDRRVLDDRLGVGMIAFDHASPWSMLR